MFLPKTLLELKALTDLPPALERFLARRPQGRRLPGLHVYVRGHTLDRYREEWGRGNGGQLPFARTDDGAELRADLRTGAVYRVVTNEAPVLLAPTFEAWLAAATADAKAVARRPLVRAARAGDTEKIARLLARGADINEQDIDGNTSLMAALLAWQYDAAQLLAQHQPDLALRDRSGHTALMWAAYRNQPGMVKQLLEAGADPQACTGNGEPVLLFALTGPHPSAAGLPNGSLEVAQLLVAAGAPALDVRSLPAGVREETDPAILDWLKGFQERGR